MEKKQFYNLVKSRRSIRKYSDKPVKKNEIIQCVEAARLAPSAENVQPWRFIVLDDSAIIKEFSEQAFSGIYRPMKFAGTAPVIVVILAKLDILANRIGKQIQGIHYYFVDIGIAGEHFVLQAEEFGLGTCWIGWFHPRKVRKILKIPRNYKIASLISVGYPAGKELKEKKCLELDDILYFNSFEKRQEK